MNKSKIVGYTFITFVLCFTFLIVCIFIIEIIDIKKRLLKSQDDKITLLHETNYYGEPKSQNPYAILNNKELHPYYLFFVPTKKIKNNEIDKNIISFNKDFFRKNTYEKSNLVKNGVLLGGSTAFGYYSSKDEFSPAALLSKYSDINFKNLNSPSWNSHQELIALIKYDYSYDNVVALTGSNDISIYCRYNKDKFYVDVPENYTDLEAIIKQWSYFNSSQIGFYTLIKSFVAKIIPDTYFLISYFINKQSGAGTFHGENTLAKETSRLENNCNSNDTKKIAEKFIQNHKQIKKIALTNNAKYSLVLQPILKDSNRYNFNSSVYNEIMNSSFCAQDCYNFIDIFKYSNLNKKFNPKSYSYEDSIFVDSVHLTDSGNIIVASEIAKILK